MPSCKSTVAAVRWTAGLYYPGSLIVVLASCPVPRSETFEALAAFVAEHQRCGVLDGGVDNGFAWLQCSCGGLIMQPESEPPKAPALNA